jgi:hypothetical protein
MRSCTGTQQNLTHTGKTFCTGKPIKNLHLPVQNEKIIYWQTVCFCTGTEPNLKHTGKTFCTGKPIKKLHLPVHKDNRLYWQAMWVLYWHGIIFESYWQDILYWHGRALGLLLLDWSSECSTTPLVLSGPDGRPCLSRELLALVRAG